MNVTKRFAHLPEIHHMPDTIEFDYVYALGSRLSELNGRPCRIVCGLYGWVQIEFEDGKRMMSVRTALRPR